MRNLRQLFRRSGLLSSPKRRQRSENPRRGAATQRRLSNEVLEKRELLAGDVGLVANHNYWNSYDVNDDFQVTARDALGIINYLGSERGEAEFVASDSLMFYDVNADSRITAADALGVINAMSRGEGDADDLVELILTARGVDDVAKDVDASGDVNVQVGVPFDVEISYDDLRTNSPGVRNRLGVFQLFTDLAFSQSGVLSPVMNETQRLSIAETISTVPYDSVTFTIEAAPPGVSGGELSYTSLEADFNDDDLAEVRAAILAFGYTSDQFDLTPVDFTNNDIGYQIHWVGDEFGNVDLPDITVEVMETNEEDDIGTGFQEFAPFLDGTDTPNTAAVRFNVNTFSRTFNDNEEFYNSQNRGEFDADGFTGLGGLGMVPIDGGGIPDLTDDGGFIRPFDAFSFRVFANQPFANLVIGVNPGEDPESTLLYGRDDAVPQDMVLFETEPVIGPISETFSEDDAQATVDLLQYVPTGNGIANVTINATADGSVQTLSISEPTFDPGDDLAGIDVDGSTLTVTPAAYGALNTGQQEVITLSYDILDSNGGSIAQTATITIDGVTDTGVQPGTLSISPATLSVDEGDAGTTTATFTVSRTGGSDGAVSVDFATANGTTNPATAGSDYTANSGTVNFADGDTAAKTFTVSIIGDTVDEVNETFTVTLSGATGGAGLGTSVSNVTITDDDEPTAAGTLSISPATLSVDEGDAGTTTATFTVSRTGGSDGAVSVDFATANGTTNPATAGSDYTANSGTVNFADGDTAAKTFTVSIIGDTADEVDETFTVTLSGATGGAGLGTSVSNVTITDDDEPSAAGTLSISPATLSVDEGDAGTTTATFTVSRTGGSDGAVSVNFATADGTTNPATAGSDYTANSGTVNFADGDTAAKTFTVSIIGDTVDEVNETFTVTLSGATGGAGLGASVSTATIIDDDEPLVAGTLSISPATLSVDEGDAGTTTATFTVSRTGGSDGAVSVNFATADGTTNPATAGSDYTANSGTVNFADGDTADKTFTVSIIGDTVDEANETFTVTLSGATGGAGLGASVSAATIIDDDEPLVAGTLSISPATLSVNEGDAGTTTATFTVSRTGGSDGAVSVDFATANGTVNGATAGSDYTANSGTVNFADGDTAAKTFTVSIIGDTVDEVNENFSVNLSGATGGASLGTSTSTVTILDDDPAGPGNAMISGFVFIDEINNIHDVVFGDAEPIRDGLKALNEVGLGGVEINLRDGNGVALTAYTDIDGKYDFEGLTTGVYEVRIHADPSTTDLIGDTEITVSITSNTQTSEQNNFPLYNTIGSASNTIDILASSYLRGDGDGEGGLVSLDSSGDQEFFVALKGYEGVSFLELTLNEDRDAALLTILEDDGDVLSARLVVGDDFIVAADPKQPGIGVQFFGGRDDHEFFPFDDVLSEFPDFLNAIDEFRDN